MFGLSIFMAIALSATGFAAWVISNDAENAQNGQVTVGAISDKAIEMSEPQFVNGIKNFVFEPNKADIDNPDTKEVNEGGRLQWDGSLDGDSNPINCENLSVTFETEIKNYTAVKDLYLEFNIKNPKTQGILKAIKDGYIKAPSWLVLEFSEETYTITSSTTAIKIVTDGTINGTEVSGSNGAKYEKVMAGKTVWTLERDFTSNKATLVFTIEFEWGSKFAGMNPGYYYDVHESGSQVNLASMRNTLHAFKAQMHNTTLQSYLDAYNKYTGLTTEDHNPDLNAINEYNAQNPIEYGFTLYAKVN